ncbi:hypothetical protein SAMN05421855_101312 [Ulvibacter litoralis]|uniref:Uncharacterized protein n=1 Tax=Ulvibacter litoralis TaxID=227084 RepID=A0A1G7CDE5_9FLAO|nr:hypothetical protein SAMN05421855_101312 [Ulvibacter litoralis]
MSLLLLVSSSGIAYAQHFCGENEMMAQLTFGEQYLSCGMMDGSVCEPPSITKKQCCENEYTKVTTDSNFAKASLDISFNKVFVASFVSVFVIPSFVTYEASQPFVDTYRPPPLYKDISVLYETFLI